MLDLWYDFWDWVNPPTPLQLGILTISDSALGIITASDAARWAITTTDAAVQSISVGDES